MSYNRYPPSGGSGTITGSVQVLGLSIAGRQTVVTIDDTNWTALPATPLVNRNGMSIQNQSAVEMKISYDPSTLGYVGTIINTNGERFYDIQASIIIYGKCQTGTGPVDILIEELS